MIEPVTRDIEPEAAIAWIGRARKRRLVLAVAATEESILNALCMAENMEGADGHFAPALPLDQVRQILKRYGYGRGRRSGSGRGTRGQRRNAQA